MENSINNQIEQLKISIIKSHKESGKKHLLITGRKKSGKTTVLNEILNEESSVGGIITSVVRDDKIMPKYVMLRDIKNPDINGVIAVRNKLCTSLIPLNNTFEILGTSILNKCIDSNVELIVIDEIGFLENSAANYQKTILACMEKKKVIFVIRKELTPFIEKMINRQDVCLLDIDHIEINV